MVVRKEGTHPIYHQFAEALDLVEAKAHDYAEDDNVFSNFEFAAQVAGVTTEQTFAVLLGVKVARLGQLIGNDKAPNFESIGDTLLDTMNYAGLLKAYIEQGSELLSIDEAMEVALTEDVPVQDGPSAWDKYKQEAEARWAAERHDIAITERDDGIADAFVSDPLEGMGKEFGEGQIHSRPDGIVLNDPPYMGNRPLKVGDIIRLTPQEWPDHRSEFKYEIMEITNAIGKIEAMPTEEWQDALGEDIRQFGRDEVELV